MVTILDGLQGSGKTYRAVHIILESNYKRVFTNIEGFKYSNRVREITYSDFSNIFSSLYALYLKQPDNLDLILIQQLIEDNILIDSSSPTLVVLDEAHNIFDKKQDFLVWLISYHRHFNLDFILITQSYSLVHYSYHKMIQEFVHALPLSRTLFGNRFKYQHHISVPYYNKTTLSKISSLRMDKQVFLAYKSGDRVRSPNVFKRYFILIAVFILIALGFVFLLKDTFFKQSSVNLEKNKKEEVFLEYVSKEDNSSTSVYSKPHYSSPLVSYSVSGGYLECTPFFHVPLTLVVIPPVYKLDRGYGFYSYYYSSPLSLCPTTQDNNSTFLNIF